MADTRDVRVRLQGDTKSLNRSMKAAERAMDATARDGGRSMKLLKNAMVTVTLAAAAMGAALLHTAAGGVELEKQLREVQTLLPDMDTDAFDALGTKVVEAAAAMGVVSDKAVPAMYQAISAGVPPDNILEFMETAAKASVGGVTQLETAVDALTTVTNTWGKSSGVTAARAADILFTSVKLGKTTMSELGASINQVAGISAEFGIGIEQVAAGFTEVTKAGVPTSEAMTKMRALIQAVTAPTVRAQTAFDKLGISVSASRVANEGFLPTLREIMAATEGNEAMQRKLFGSVEALQAALVITSQDGAGFAATLDAMHNSAGAADAAFATMSTSFSHQWGIVKARVTSSIRLMGVRVLPTLTAALVAAVAVVDDRIAPAFRSFAAVVEHLGGVALPPLREALVWLSDTARQAAAVLSAELLGALEALSPAMVGIAAILEQVLLAGWGRAIDLAFKFSDAYGTEITVVLVALAALISTRIMPVIEAFGDLWDRTIGRFVGGADSASASGESMRDRLLAVWETITGAVAAVSGAVSAAWSAMTAVVDEKSAGMIAYWREHVWPALSGLRDFFGIILSAIVELTRQAMTALRAIIQTAVKAIQIFWAVFGDSILAVMSRTWDLIGAVVITALELIGNVITVALDAISLVFGGFADVYYGRWDQLWERVKTLFGSVWELITDLFSGTLGVLLDLAQVFGEGVEQVFRLLWRAVTSVTRAGLDSVTSILTAGRDRITAVIGQILAPIQSIISAAHAAADAISSIPALPSLPSLPDIPGGGLLSKIPGFASGGTVPGPVGAPQLAVVHGGERILTPAQQRGGSTMNLNLSVRVEGGVISEGDLGGYIVDEINRAVRRGDVSLPGA